MVEPDCPWEFVDKAQAPNKRHRAFCLFHNREHFTKSAKRWYTGCVTSEQQDDGSYAWVLQIGTQPYSVHLAEKNSPGIVSHVASSFAKLLEELGDPQKQPSKRYYLQQKGKSASGVCIELLQACSTHHSDRPTVRPKHAVPAPGQPTYTQQLEQQCASTQHKLSQTEHQLSQAKQQLAEQAQQLADKDRKIAARDSALAELLQAYDDLLQAYQLLQQQHGALQQQYEQLQQDYAALKEQHAVVQLQHAAVNAELAATKQKAAAAWQAADDARRSLAGLQRKYGPEWAAEIKRLESRASYNISRAAERKHQRDKLHSQIKQAQQELKDVKRSGGAALVKLQKAYGDRWLPLLQKLIPEQEKLQQALAARQQQLAALKQQRSSLADERQQLQRSYNQRRGYLLDCCNQHSKELKEKFELAMMRTRQLGKENRKLQSRLDSSMEQQQQLQRQLVQQQEQCSLEVQQQEDYARLLASQLEDVQQQVEALKSDLKSYQDPTYVPDQQRSQPAAAAAAITLKAFRTSRVFQPADVQQLQCLIQDFNLQGARIKDLLLRVLQLVVMDSKGQPLTLEQLEGLVRPPAFSTMYKHTQLMGEVRMIRQGQVVQLSIRWTLVADGGDVAREKRLLVSLGSQFKGAGALLRMAAAPCASNAGADTYEAVMEHVVSARNLPLANLIQIMTDAASPNHQLKECLLAAKQLEIQKLFSAGVAVPGSVVADFPPSMALKYCLVPEGHLAATAAAKDAGRAAAAAATTGLSQTSAAAAAVAAGGGGTIAGRGTQVVATAGGGKG